MSDQSKSEQPIDTSAQRVDGIDLPPLPEPDEWRRVNGGEVFFYDGAKMRAYAAAAVAAERERWCAWLETQRNDIPATGSEFAAAIRGEQQ
jgi:hypothetical protein